MLLLLLLMYCFAALSLSFCGPFLDLMPFAVFSPSLLFFNRYLLLGLTLAASSSSYESSISPSLPPVDLPTSPDAPLSDMPYDTVPPETDGPHLDSPLPCSHTSCSWPVWLACYSVFYTTVPVLPFHHSNSSGASVLPWGYSESSVAGSHGGGASCTTGDSHLFLPLPPGKVPISCRWFYKLKTRFYGSVPWSATKLVL